MNSRLRTLILTTYAVSAIGCGNSDGSGGDGGYDAGDTGAGGDAGSDAGNVADVSPGTINVSSVTPKDDSSANLGSIVKASFDVPALPGFEKSPVTARVKMRDDGVASIVLDAEVCKKDNAQGTNYKCDIDTSKSVAGVTLVPGDYRLTFVAENAANPAKSSAYEVKVTLNSGNKNPTIDKYIISAAWAGSGLNMSLYGSDPDGDPVRWFLTSETLPETVVVDDFSGLVGSGVLSTPGNYSLEIQAIDTLPDGVTPKGGSASIVIPLAVDPREYEIDVLCTASASCPGGNVKMHAPKSIADVLGTALTTYDSLGNTTYENNCSASPTQVNGAIKTAWNGLSPAQKDLLKHYDSAASKKLANIDSKFSAATPCTADPNLAFRVRVTQH